MMISYLLLVFTSWWRLIDYQDLRFSRAVLTIPSRSAPYNVSDSCHTPLCINASISFDRACTVLSLLHTIATLSLLWNLYLHSHEVSNTPGHSLSSPLLFDCLISLLSLFISYRDWVIAVTDAGQASHFHMVRISWRKQYLSVWHYFNIYVNLVLTSLP